MHTRYDKLLKYIQMFKIHLKTTKKSVTTTIQMKDEMAQLKKMNNAYILTIKEHQLDLDIL